MRCLFLGRWQPFHKGHQALIHRELAKGNDVIIGIRNTEQSDQNPYTFAERAAMIIEHFGIGLIGTRIEIVKVPDFDEVCYGRTPGYSFRQIHLDPDMEAVSGTEIRMRERDSYYGK